MVFATRAVRFIFVVVASAALWCTDSSAMSAGDNASTGTLSGTVTRAPVMPVERPGAPSSAPAVGVTVDVTSPEGREIASAVTDSAGKYSISLPPGTYRVSVRSGPVGRPVEPADVTITNGAETTQDLRIDTRIR